MEGDKWEQHTLHRIDPKRKLVRLYVDLPDGIDRKQVFFDFLRVAAQLWSRWQQSLPLIEQTGCIEWAVDECVGCLQKHGIAACEETKSDLHYAAWKLVHTIDQELRNNEPATIAQLIHAETVLRPEYIANTRLTDKPCHANLRNHSRFVIHNRNAGRVAESDLDDRVNALFRDMESKLRSRKGRRS